MAKAKIGLSHFYKTILTSKSENHNKEEFN